MLCVTKCYRAWPFSLFTLQRKFVLCYRLGSLIQIIRGPNTVVILFMLTWFHTYLYHTYYHCSQIKFRWLYFLDCGWTIILTNGRSPALPNVITHSFYSFHFLVSIINFSFFTISNSIRSSRSRTGLLLSAFVGVTSTRIVLLHNQFSTKVTSYRYWSHRMNPQP